MKKSKLIVILALIISIPFVVLLVKPNVQEFTIEYSLHLDEKGGGVNVDTDKIYFGTLSYKTIGHSWRPFNVTNNFSNSYNVKFFVSGDLVNNIIFSENNFVLNPLETKTVNINVITDEYEFEPGHYTGNVKAVYTQIR